MIVLDIDSLFSRVGRTTGVGERQIEQPLSAETKFTQASRSEQIQKLNYSIRTVLPITSARTFVF